MHWDINREYPSDTPDGWKGVVNCEQTKWEKGAFFASRTHDVFVIWPRREKIYLRRFVNNTGADQPAHPRSLISAFVIRYLESIIVCKLATGEISIF